MKPAGAVAKTQTMYLPNTSQFERSLYQRLIQPSVKTQMTRDVRWSWKRHVPKVEIAGKYSGRTNVWNTCFILCSKWASTPQ